MVTEAKQENVASAEKFNSLRAAATTTNRNNRNRHYCKNNKNFAKGIKQVAQHLLCESLTKNIHTWTNVHLVEVERSVWEASYAAFCVGNLKLVNVVLITNVY